MYESFVYSVNTVIPIFILAIAGFVIRRANLLDDAFFSQSERLVFNVALPAMLFYEIVTAGEESAADPKFIIFCVAGIIAVFIAAMILASALIKGNPQKSSFVQAAYRSNFAILGIPLVQNMFGDAGVQKIAVVMPFTIAAFNALAVICFSVFAPAEKKLTKREAALRILRSIAKNPLIIAIASASAFYYLRIPLPKLVLQPVSYLSDLTLPLSLLSLGANFTFASMRAALSLSVPATVIKIAVVPAAAVLAAIAFGFTGAELGVIFVLFGGPCAVSGYIMAKSMGGDHILTGQITLMTTFFCTFTVFGGVFALRFFGLI